MQAAGRSDHVKLWTARLVTKKLRAEEITKLTLELSGESEAGKGKFIEFYQTALSKFYNEHLTDQERKEYENTAKEWNEEGTPMEVKKR
jgi:hypothetical protein